MNRQQTISRAVRESEQDTRQDIKGIFDCKRSDCFKIALIGYTVKGDLFSLACPITGKGESLKKAKRNFLNKFLAWSKGQFNLTNLNSLDITDNRPKRIDARAMHQAELTKHCKYHWARADIYLWNSRTSATIKRKQDISSSIRWNRVAIDNDSIRYERIENNMDCGYSGMTRGTIDPITGRANETDTQNYKGIRTIRDKKQIALIKMKSA